MSRKFTIITKDGSKWLRTPSPYNPETEPASTRWFHEEKCPDLLYIGNLPEGATVDESEVREVIQWRFHFETDWRIDPIEESAIDYADMEAQTAYTDTESHDRHISDDYPGIDYQPLFNHMSKVHGLTLTTSEMDEIIGLSTYILAKK